MAATVQIATRIPKDVKDRATKVVQGYGLDLSSAVRMFVTEVADERRIPIRVDRPKVSYDGDSFGSDQEYFEQIPGFLGMLDKEAASDETYTPKESGWKL
ncbi:MAG: type II toxin-antitoxin system RelB/DinJ family antitoxin [Coriobacteriales bacterium]|jgi:addiction module RelB/DinJ family antitoxin|nr:type II toxin-antitoxin system RelB/DinJ family antitoxin [Coriobacteriales bacterium]